MAGDEVVLHRVEDGVAVLTLNRPDRLNAWTSAMERRYFDLLAQAAGDPEVRVVVVTGAGRGFCAGVDMDDLDAIGEAGSVQGDWDRRPQTFPLSVRKPLIAAINGACAGLGLVQALMCDLRFAAAGAKLTTAFARRGLVAEHGISWVLPRLVGPARALDLLLSGRVVLAEEALALGLVNRVVEADSLLATVLDYARDVAANCSPASVAAMKSQVYRHLQTDLATAMDESNRLMAESLRAADFREGVASFVERRPPKFEPLDPERGLGPDPVPGRLV
ncbi:MAG TPA: enoyl-CoA hydratase [Acidimicrobiales bacterium]|nr:enoyl-CoA hydratase [Acidimicrobiales bacterium]